MEFYPKYWKTGNFTQNTGILASFYFSFDFLIGVYLLNRVLYLLNSLNETLKNSGKWKEILEKSGKFVSPQMWEPCV